MKLDEEVIGKFAVAKVFKDFKSKINSIDFSFDGEHLLASSDDESITIYNCNSGVKKQSIYSKKYGACLLRCVRYDNHVLHGSTKVDNTIRYLSWPDTKYIHYFIGHSKQVTDVSVSMENHFMSASLDTSARLWDLRSPSCQAYIKFDQEPLISIDPPGMIFAAGLDSEKLNLYDIRSCDKGPFVSWDLSSGNKKRLWNSVKFSPDGLQIMITADDGTIQLIDSFKGNVISNFSVQSSSPSETCRLPTIYSPDSVYTLSGLKSGQISIWTSEKDSRPIANLSSINNESVNCLAFNSKLMLLATSFGDSLCMWLPRDVDND